MTLTPNPRHLRRTSTWAAVLALMAGAISTVPATAATTVVNVDFESGSYAPLVANGVGVTDLKVVEVDGGKALQVSNRANDYSGVATPAGVLEPGTTYDFSVDVKLADGVAATEARLVGFPDYTWIGNTTVTATDWTTISGTWTVPADATAADTKAYVGTSDLNPAAPYTYLVDNFTVTTADPTDPVGGAETPAPATTALSNDFEETLDPWGARGSGEATVTLATEAHQGEQAALVSGRTNAWNGLAASATALQAGAVYNLSAAVKLPAGVNETADIRFSVQRDVPDDAADKWVTLSTITGVTSSVWTPINISFTTPADPQLIYFETSTGTVDFLVDSIVVTGQSGEVQDLLPIKDTVDFPVGVAIDQRETTGEASELLLKHFNQITPENHMKPEAWYDAEHNFSPDPQIQILMDYARANDLRVYGHVLVWYSQTPEWFFQNNDGEALTTSEADKQFLRDRLRTHIFNIAEYLSGKYGDFGSDTNPLVAWDVVNEVISDDAQADGLRRSEWYRILGPEFVDLAFENAEEAFNVTYAADGVDRPVALFINDYNTEYGDKQGRYRQVIEGLLARDIPIDGVGHQFHVSLSTPVSLLEAALDRFADLPLVQAITELDVGVDGAANQALLIEQGHYYKDAFNVFREHSEDLYSVTIWGLTDGRSWRTENSPLVFTDTYQAKQAYYGIVDSDELASIILRGTVFEGSAEVSAAGLQDQMWGDLPLNPIGDDAGFQARWGADHLTIYVESATAFDEIRVSVGDQIVTVPATGADGAEVSRDATGALIRIPGTFAIGESINLDVTLLTGDV